MNSDELLVKTYDINNKTYIVINELDIDNIHYICLSNEDNEKDIMIRKEINGYLELLDNEEEIKKVLKEIVK